MTDRNSNIPPPPIRALLGVVVGCSVVCAGVMAAWLLPTATSEQAERFAKAIALGGGAVLAPGVLAVVLLGSLAKTPQANLGAVCLAFSGVRLFGTVATAMIAVSVVDPERGPFVNTLLLGAMSGLVLETMILRRWASLDATGQVEGATR